MAALFKQMTICGVGLIGGSLALAVRKQGLVGRIAGLGRTQANLEAALKRGMLDFATRDPAEAARGADLVMLAAPIRAMPAALGAMLAHLPPNAVVTDVGSVKGWVIQELEPMLRPGMALVAAHPMAGKESRGAAAADERLFVDRRVIVTPSATSAPEAVAKVEALWRAAGARVERMEAGMHDELVARASHLPQIAASALAAALEEERVGGRLAAEFGAEGLRDMTRIAASPAEMWRDICLTNRGAILRALQLFSATFEEFRRQVERGDGDALGALFERGHRMRERLR